MKTIVVLSDTHGNRADISKISNIILESDYVFHLGDCYGDFVDYAYALKGKASGSRQLRLWDERNRHRDYNRNRGRENFCHPRA